MKLSNLISKLQTIMDTLGDHEVLVRFLHELKDRSFEVFNEPKFDTNVDPNDPDDVILMEYVYYDD